MKARLIACATLLLASCTDGSSTVSVTASSVVTGNNGAGTVVSDPPGIDCTVTAGAPTGGCSASFAQNAIVTLTATPTGSSAFDGWVNVASGTDFDYEQTLGFESQAPLSTNPLPLDVDTDRDLAVLPTFALATP